MAKLTSKSHTPEDRKIHPKLRMITNGDSTVNILRAEQSASLAARTKTVAAKVPRLRAATSAPLSRAPAKVKARRKIKVVTDDVLVNVFVELEDGTDKIGPIPGETGRMGNLATAQIPLSRIGDLAAKPGVSYVSPGDVTNAPTPEISLAHVSAPRRPASVRRTISAHHNGRDVLIGIIDVQGFDFTHSDFLESTGNTRFIRIWDQGGTARPSPKESGSAPYDYGAEFTGDHLNAAIGAAANVGVSALDLEPQSQMADPSHGTHVASIAAGNRGVCSEAKIAGVLIDLADEDMDRRLSFYDSTRIAHAVDYLFRLGAQLDLPVSINISLGTNGHAHDATSAVSRWIDFALVPPGRSVCVAAGNAGQEGPTHADDFGFVMGRIHTSGQIRASGLAHDIFWNVVGNGIADISENELEIWYEAQDRVAISVRPPGQAWIGPVEPGHFIENRQLDDLSFLSIYNELYHPANGANHASVYLSPFLSPELGQVAGVRAGTWVVRLHGSEIRDGRFHGWIERDDPRRIGDTSIWRFPSFFAVESNIDNSSVSSLACGQRIVSVANLDEAEEEINITSSQGPTRDGRAKPEVAGPGTDIVAARGFGPADEEWIAMSGTSMASPYVAGVIGLMLAVERRLTAAQIGGIIKRTARPLPGHDFAWANDAGFGRIDVEACIEEAKQVADRTEIEP
jgi:subtilisin family serine protease